MSKPLHTGRWPSPPTNAAPSASLSPSKHANDGEQQLISSCESFTIYPCNLNRTLTLEHTLDLYRRTLSDQSQRLFNPSPQTKLFKFWETNEAGDGFEEFKPQDFVNLKNRCEGRGGQDPKCRYVFIQSKNARARLEVTRDDFAYLASYHQVMPSFLDLVFTCGRQERPQDFHYAAFRHENYLAREDQDQNRNRSFMMERLGRSGRQIQHCFTLHSVERSGSNPEWGWSIRQTVAYHSFDVETGKSFWIFIKGNDVMEKRIRKATLSTRDLDMKASSHQTLTGSFGASLTAHIQMMEWCGEQWRWYINEVETLLRDKAKYAVLADVDNLAGPASVPAPSRLNTLITKTPRTTISNASPTSPISPISPSKIWARFSGTSKAEKRATVDESNMLRPIHADNIVEEPEQIDGTADDAGDDDDELKLEKLFSFEKLQDLHQIGEYMQEAQMVLKQNRNIIREIREHYAALMQSEDVPAEIRHGCKLDISKFNQRAQSIEKDLDVQQSRLETLYVLLEDRSNLFYTVQQYASMQASKHFAMNAQAATDFTTDMTARMHTMTEKMHDIAVKTNNQTVSMHVITVFTLVFLPGTFLATFFSSGILRWYDSDDEMAGGSGYSWVTERDRLLLFVEIVVPMMVLIIVAWLALYLRSRKARRNEEEKQQQQQELIDLEKGPEASL